MKEKKTHYIKADNGVDPPIVVPVSRRQLSDMLNWSAALGTLASMAIEGEGIPGVAPDDVARTMPSVPERLLKT